MVPADWTAPAASSTIGGNTFNWAQLTLANHSFIKGQNLISSFQLVYRREYVANSGMVLEWDARPERDLLHDGTDLKPERHG
jgi:hypothetical protein